ncbi:hypothetical protein KL86DYS1_11263 [uncultured Dysgonomonas sp.]|uniref:Uncharacterized protein n=1 Tax=uncultured Dysgonomonas sp. TaxID=206096 RepID=A0A212J665_9BACT|nr:hypothetical protein KL86DYS1_11263 [uncultured Dysgonomonas sp.]
MGRQKGGYASNANKKIKFGKHHETIHIQNQRPGIYRSRKQNGG